MTIIRLLLILFISVPGLGQDGDQEHDVDLTKKRMQTIHRFYSLLNAHKIPTRSDSYSIISPHTELELSVTRDSLGSDDAMYDWLKRDSRTTPSLSFVRIRQERHRLQIPPEVDGLPTFSAFPTDNQRIKVIFKNHPEALQVIFQFSPADSAKIIDIFLNGDKSLFSQISNE